MSHRIRMEMMKIGKTSNYKVKIWIKMIKRMMIYQKSKNRKTILKTQEKIKGKRINKMKKTKRNESVNKERLICISI